MALAPWVYEKARKAARFHLQVEVVEVAPRRPAHVAARVVRVFRGHERIRVGERVEFDVPVAAAGTTPEPGEQQMPLGELAGAKFLEVFLDGELPHCDPVGILLPVVLAAPTGEPVVRAMPSAAASTPGSPSQPVIGTAPTALAAGSAPATALAASSAPATALATGTVAETVLAAGSAPATTLAPKSPAPTSMAPGPAPPTALAGAPTATSTAAPSPPPAPAAAPLAAPPPPAPLPPAPPSPLRRPTMQGRGVPPATQVQPQRNPTLAFPPGRLSPPASVSFPPPLMPPAESDLWTLPPLEAEPAVSQGPPLRRRTKTTWIVGLLFLLVFVLGGGIAFFLLRNNGELVVGPGHIPTIGEALQKARTDRVDTIRILPGTYREALRLDRKVRLVGDGPREEVVVNGGNTPALTVEWEGDAGSINGLTLRCEAEPNGKKHPAVSISGGTLELNDCDIDWMGDFGPNRRNTGACVEVADTGTRLTLKGCRLRHGWQGLSVVAGAEPVVENCTIENNQVGVWVDQAGGRFEKCIVRQNRAVNVFVAGSGARVELKECEVLGGECDGVVFTQEARGELIGGTIQEHRGSGNHAVWIKEKATARLTGCDVCNNRMGVLVDDGGKAELSACKVHNNTGLALEVRGADSSLDAGGCRKADLYDNGEGPDGNPWAFDDEKALRKPN
jgi:hypothetical protein